MNRNTFRKLALGLSLSGCCIGGCGTVENLAGANPPSTVYGGVRRDVKQVVQSTREVIRGDHDGAVALAAGTGALCALDAPLSAVGDTITLPVTVVRTLKSRSE